MTRELCLSHFTLDRGVCTFLLTSIISIGDFIKLGIEINYIAQDAPGASYILYHIVVYSLILVCRYTYEQLESSESMSTNQNRLLPVISILFCIEFAFLIALGFLTQIYSKSFIIIGCVLSLLVNEMYIRHYVVNRLRHAQIHPIQEIILTQYPLKSHQCESDCNCCPCIICSETIDCLIELPCKHSIHHSCFITWKLRKNTCPLCRSIV